MFCYIVPARHLGIGVIRYMNMQSSRRPHPTGHSSVPVNNDNSSLLINSQHQSGLHSVLASLSPVPDGTI